MKFKHIFPFAKNVLKKVENYRYEFKYRRMVLDINAAIISFYAASLNKKLNHAKTATILLSKSINKLDFKVHI